MHQNLKFNLCESARDDWQTILASQLYGTFYCVYVKFINYEEITLDNGKTHHIYSCQYYLQNFKGQISLGFKADPKLEMVMDKDENDPIDFKFKFIIEPFNNDWKTSIIEHKLTTELFIPGQTLDADVRMAPPPSFMYDKKHPENALYLHPEEFKRDGEHYLSIKYKQHGKEDQVVLENDDDGYGWFPNICDQTRSIIR